MTAHLTAEESTRSAECQLAARGRGYKDLHGWCRQTDDIPLPYGRGILLQRRCRCTCHRTRKSLPAVG
jgi:hypothetical protein